jgi:hypothetical protein
MYEATRICKGCGVDLPAHVGRGRPRVWCANCDGAVRKDVERHPAADPISSQGELYRLIAEVRKNRAAKAGSLLLDSVAEQFEEEIRQLWARRRLAMAESGDLYWARSASYTSVPAPPRASKPWKRDRRRKPRTPLVNRRRDALVPDWEQVAA